MDHQPENGVALSNLALLFNGARRFAEAESLAVRGLTVTPNQWALYTNAAVAQIGQAKYAAAARTVTLMEQRSPTNPLRSFLRGFLALGQRHYDSAEVAARSLAAPTTEPPGEETPVGTPAAIILVRSR